MRGFRKMAKGCLPVDVSSAIGSTCVAPPTSSSPSSDSCNSGRQSLRTKRFWMTFTVHLCQVFDARWLTWFQQAIRTGPVAASPRPPATTATGSSA